MTISRQTLQWTACLAVLVSIIASLTFAPLSTASEEEIEGPPRPHFVVMPYLQLPTPTSMRVMWETNYRMPGRVEFGTTRDLGQVAEAKTDAELHSVVLSDLKPATTYHYRVRCGDLVSEIYSFRSGPLAGTKKWRMALYGDSRSSAITHRKVVDQIAKANVDLFVHTGDIVLNGKNRASWRDEFFEPLAPVARSVPWLATIGNHENDAESFFSYVAVPGTERFFGFDYGNAHFICLDSNAWIEKGRDSEQYRWLEEHLKKKRSATWTFVVFHHPLFSAMAARPINSLRWDWAPLMLDPGQRVDGMLTGHDHFYARSHRIGRVTKDPQPGVLCITSAGGGALLYRSKDRDYIAAHKPVYHFTQMDFDGEEVKFSAIDITGKVFDTYTLTKKPAAPDEFCSYEVEDLRRNLRLALENAAGLPVREGEPTTINTELRIPARFQVPMTGELLWKSGDGWKLKEQKSTFRMEPNQPLVIPLQATVAAGPFASSPTLTIQFAEGRFRNRTIEVWPYKFSGVRQVKAAAAKQAPKIDGKLDDAVWRDAVPNSLLGLPPRGGRTGRVQVGADPTSIYVAVRIDDPMGKVKVKEFDPKAERNRFILFDEHVRVVVSDGKTTWLFAITPEQLRYAAKDKSEDTGIDWQCACGQEKGAWTAELALPRKLFAAHAKLRINVLHQLGGLRAPTFELCPTYLIGGDPDVIPDWWAGDSVEGHAQLLID
ncbi:MAG: metallophosphoesterase [Gemmataceae bacterium]|nr:metallophosphoesterase [Gemmataceae bacterium]